MANPQEALSSSALDEHLDVAHDRYTRGNPISSAMDGEARQVLPGGHTRTVLHYAPFPFRVAKAEGSILTDVDGHRLVDLLGNYTAGLAGHSPAPVAAAITDALAGGWSLGSVHPNEIRFAELLCHRFPAIDQVRFTNSGTEANLMALATARHLTGRSAVLGFHGGYHGGVLTFGSHGQAVNVPFDVELATFNDLDSVADILARRGGEIAALIVEPMLGSAGCIPAQPGFLAGVIEQCRQHGVLVIFDEVMTSRLGPGGAHGRFGLDPDLVTLGKYLAGGMSFGAFGGSASLMAVYDGDRPPPGFDPLGHAGTFNNNVLTMAAGVATLTQVATPEAVVELAERGDRLRLELDALFETSAIPMQVTGIGSLLNIHPMRGPIHSPADLDGDDRWRELFFFAMISAGFYLARRGFIALSLAVTDDQIEQFLDSVDHWLSSIDTERAPRRTSPGA